MTVLPPEPHLVRWYFKNRERAGLDSYTAEQIRFNEWLWKAICERGKPPGGHEMAANKLAAGRSTSGIVRVPEATPATPRGRPITRRDARAVAARERMRRRREFGRKR